MDELERIKEQEKEQIRLLGQRVVAEQQAKRVQFEEKTDQILEKMQESIDLLEKVLEQLNASEKSVPSTKKAPLHLVPPIQKEQS